MSTDNPVNQADIPFTSDIVPEVMELETEIQFRCHKEISCFNACCKQADITLAPYDIIRLKQRLDKTSSEFLADHTVPFEMDRDGLPGVKLQTDNDGACSFLTEEGCSVYEDRPAVCRYYPVAMLAMHLKDSATDEAHFSLVKESHCMGHKEDRTITIGDYRKEQEAEVYDEHNRGWLQLMLKKRSAGPSIGRPSSLSLQLFFMASYDQDRFRRFIASDSFKNSYELADSTYEAIANDDIIAMEFGYQFLRQILFAEKTLEEQKGAFEKRIEERHEILKMRRESEIAEARKREEEQRREIT